MKNPLKHLTKLGKLSHLRFRAADYSLVARGIEELILRQERFIDRVSWRSDLPPKVIRTLIHESTTIMTFAILAGFDLGELKGAAIGAVVGFVIVIGNIAFRIFFIRGKEGLELAVVRA